ncbi:aminotransferase class I/II [Enterococcus ureilyticus]|uniref:cysteine-S-conjugate beta-lyase n=1 Tax=Enterococcus ureilyticus TaxID=1131292 RepID=A0A1E5HG61_9ENTE|nr:MalY/PatB family protein [Enterococcus ureilyticus]MBM7689365.1 cystathionine beta-lyase [Enterococcus ureilyticus]MBO0446562.1 pyridoxal phosphate-dependent aminotransferase [Enterococcus ureilyticus]OEG23630.1 aminotransferase class I/II [Enterococcus ureilyticus]
MVNFDRVYDRRNTNCSKWDSIKDTYGEDGLLPLWIADMDFKANLPVLEALKETAEQGILGYSPAPDSLYEAIQSWQKRHHDFSVGKEAILFNSGVVPSLSLAIQAYTEPGDAVLIHDPVYPPFAKVVEQNNRKLIRSQLLIEQEHFVMDLEMMAKQIVDENVRVVILCNPHNPGGRVWSKSELEAFGKLCAKYDVLVISDEIHQDLIFAPHVFTTFTNVHPTFKDFSITLTAATKTFNLAGIKNSMIFIENPDLRKKFVAAQEQNFQNEINIFGYVGTEAAYKNGDTWLKELLVYLKENIDLVSEFLQTELPKVKMMRPEGTYLIWLDFSALDLSDTQIQNRLVHQGKVVLNPGISFGPNGTQHMRLNIACPKETLVEGLHRIKHSFE